MTLFYEKMKSFTVFSTETVSLKVRCLTISRMMLIDVIFSRLVETSSKIPTRLTGYLFHVESERRKQGGNNSRVNGIARGKKGIKQTKKIVRPISRADRVYCQKENLSCKLRTGLALQRKV